MSSPYRKPALVGLDNPHSDDPAKALGLDPVGGSGYRLWLMLKEAANRSGKDLSGDDYLETFDRINLFNSHDVFDRFEVLKKLGFRKVIMCGTRVPKLLGFRYRGFDMVPRRTDNFTFYVIPHPSGLCREYNDPDMRQRVGDLLFDTYKDFRDGF